MNTVYLHWGKYTYELSRRPMKSSVWVDARVTFGDALDVRIDLAAHCVGAP